MSHAILDWMKWYPGDFWGSIAVLRLSEAACNLYRWMLDYQWVHGAVPDDAVVVSRLYPWGQTALDSWREVRPFFDSVDGSLVNRKLAEIYEEQLAKTSRFAAAGKASAQARTKRYGSAQPLEGRSPERRSNVVPNDVRTSSEQGGEGKGRERKGEDVSRAPRATRAKPTGDHAEAIRFFEAKFLAETGSPYAVEGAKDGEHVRVLLSRGGLPEFQARARTFFADKWHRETGLTISKFRTAWNNLVVAKPPPPPPPRLYTDAEEIRAKREAARQRQAAERAAEQKAREA